MAPTFAFDWKPDGRTLAAYKKTRITDGDTPFIEMSIRMLSIDTPEVHYPGNSKPSKQDAALAELGRQLDGGAFAKIPTKLRKHLVHCLDDKAGTRQLEQGEAATKQYQGMLDVRMKTKSGRGTRELFVRSADEVFDAHGRLLAYVAPSYDQAERAAMALYERRTFNLQLVEEGWAAPFLIYPSLPSKADLALFWAAARKARVNKLGCYADSKMLAGYEFRNCVKMVKGQAEGPTRYCAHLRTGKIYKPEDYVKVQPEDRLFIWAKDRKKATKALGLEEQW